MALDPALFGLEFERFWGEGIGSVWQTIQSAAYEHARPFCACTDLELPGDGAPTSSTWTDDYRDLPAIGDQSFYLEYGVASPTIISCDQARPPVVLGGENLPTAAILRLDPRRRYYTTFTGPGSLSAKAGNWIQTTCEAVETVEVASDAKEVAVGVPGPGTWYARLHSSSGWIDRTDTTDAVLGYCMSCSDPDCMVASPHVSSGANLGSTLYLQIDVPASAGPSMTVVRFSVSSPP